MAGVIHSMYGYEFVGGREEVVNTNEHYYDVTIVNDFMNVINNAVICSIRAGFDVDRHVYGADNGVNHVNTVSIHFIIVYDTFDINDVDTIT